MDASGGSSRPYLIHIVDRYGPQIEADFHRELDLDLLDFFRGKHPWGKLLRMLDQLPSTSRYITAQRADDEYVQSMVDAGVNLDAKAEMTEFGYSPEAARLDNIFDAVNALRHVVLQIVGEGSGPFSSVERPTNAIQKYKQKARLQRHHDLLDEVEVARARRRQLAG